MKQRETMDKARIEAFSDGVIAVAITLLALDLHTDAESGAGTLAHQLSTEWPSFAAYLLSFFIIGVIWVNHHALFALAARADRLLMFHNLVLLMWVTTIPFTTSTLASFLRRSHSDARLAVVVYGISMEGMAIGFTLILRHLIRRGLLINPVPEAEGRLAVRKFGLGTVVYPVIVLIGLAWPVITLFLYTAVVVYYMAEQTPILPVNDAIAAGSTAAGSTEQDRNED